MGDCVGGCPPINGEGIVRAFVSKVNEIGDAISSTANAVGEFPILVLVCNEDVIKR